MFRRLAALALLAAAVILSASWFQSAPIAVGAPAESRVLAFAAGSGYEDAIREVLAPRASGRVIYCDSSAAGGGTGTLTSPLGGASAFEDAWDIWAQGDTIALRYGSAFECTGAIIKTRGTGAAVIVYDAPDPTSIDKTATVVDLGGYGIKLSLASDVRFRDFTLTDWGRLDYDAVTAGTQLMQAAVYLAECDGLWFDNMECDGESTSSGACIRIDGVETSTLAARPAVVSNCELHHTDGDGIQQFWNTPLVAYGNYIHDLTDSSLKNSTVQDLDVTGLALDTNLALPADYFHGVTVAKDSGSLLAPGTDYTVNLVAGTYQLLTGGAFDGGSGLATGTANFRGTYSVNSNTITLDSDVDLPGVYVDGVNWRIGTTNLVLDTDYSVDYGAQTFQLLSGGAFGAGPSGVGTLVITSGLGRALGGTDAIVMHEAAAAWCDIFANQIATIRGKSGIEIKDVRDGKVRRNFVKDCKVRIASIIARQDVGVTSYQVDEAGETPIAPGVIIEANCVRMDLDNWNQLALGAGIAIGEGGKGTLRYNTVINLSGYVQVAGSYANIYPACSIHISSSCVAYGNISLAVSSVAKHCVVYGDLLHNPADNVVRTLGNTFRSDGTGRYVITTTTGSSVGGYVSANTLYDSLSAYDTAVTTAISPVEFETGTITTDPAFTATDFSTVAEFRPDETWHDTVSVNADPRPAYDYYGQPYPAAEGAMGAIAPGGLTAPTGDQDRDRSMEVTLRAGVPQLVSFSDEGTRLDVQMRNVKVEARVRVAFGVRDLPPSLALVPEAFNEERKSRIVFLSRERVGEPPEQLAIKVATRHVALVSDQDCVVILTLVDPS